MSPGGGPILLDSNVGFWLTYSKASTASLPQLKRCAQVSKDYSKYVKQIILKSGEKPKVCALSFLEIAKTIEGCEVELYRQDSGKYSADLKDIRHGVPGLHDAIVAEIRSAWKSLESFTDLVGDAVHWHDALSQLQAAEIDPADAVVALVAKRHASARVLTDDADFVTVNGLEVHTANSKAIASAVAAQRCVR